MMMTERRRLWPVRQVGANDRSARAVLAKHGSRRAARLLTDERTSAYD
jgi:hypothetical protein